MQRVRYDVRLDPNHSYLAAKAESLGGGTVLDYGCGKAHVVEVLRSKGVDAYGADVFWGGMTWSEQDEPLSGFLAQRIVRQITDGRLPFDDDTFDVIVSDQVLEHVDNVAAAVGEMRRVLKPAGRMYHQFPARNVLVEAHTKIPLAHRIPHRFRARYLEGWRRLGFGRHPLHLDDPAEWARWGADWIEQFCVYRSRGTIERTFSDYGFVVVHQEAQSCLYRAQGHRAERFLNAAIHAMPSLASGAFQLLGHDCVEVAWAASPAPGEPAG